MAEITPIKLFFLKNVSHNFAPVEKFLKKRGYEVFVETDVKIGFDKIVEIDPDYIFLAWDHKSEGLRQMPKMIYQSSTAQIVPFIMSTQRDQIIQIESSGFENKLYPPLSGPAIQRVIQKTEKKNQVFDQITTAKKGMAAAKKEEMIQVKSFFKEDDRPNDVTVSGGKTNAEEESKHLASKTRNRMREFSQKQSSFGSASAKVKVRTGSGEFNSGGEKNFSDIRMEGAVEKEFSSMTGLAGQNERQFGHGGISVNEEIEMTSGSTGLSKDEKKLSPGQVSALDESFNATVKPEMFDIIETYSEQKTTSNLNDTTQIYVMVIQEIEWTGYLTVASENFLDIASAQIILNNWIKQMIRIEKIDVSAESASEETMDMPDSVLMQMRVPNVNFADFCSYKSEFFKEILFQDKKTMIGFFSFSPYQVINSMHPKYDFLELPTEFLQPEEELPFDVNLFLPENKKFIKYLKPGFFLDKIQVERLQKRNVEYVYSGLEHELDVLKYKAEFNIRGLINSYNRIKDTP